MTHRWKNTVPARTRHTAEGIGSLRTAAAIERRIAADLLDECEEVARDMASAGIGSRAVAGEAN